MARAAPSPHRRQIDQRTARRLHLSKVRLSRAGPERRADAMRGCRRATFTHANRARDFGSSTLAFPWSPTVRGKAGAFDSSPKRAPEKVSPEAFCLAPGRCPINGLVSFVFSSLRRGGAASCSTDGYRVGVTAGRWIQILRFQERILDARQPGSAKSRLADP
jgi:hypothetical protein